MFRTFGRSDGAGVVLVRFFFRLAVWGLFVDPLGRSWGRFGVLPDCFGVLLGPCGDKMGAFFVFPWSFGDALVAAMGQVFLSSRLPSSVLPINRVPS